MKIKKILLLVLLTLSLNVDGKSATARATLNVADSVEINSPPPLKNISIDATSSTVIVGRNKMISIIENNKTKTLSSGRAGEVKTRSKIMIELFP